MFAMMAEADSRFGWDLAGTVITQAASGAGPKAGSRVMALVDAGSWAEQVAVPTNRLAELPASVTFAQAAALPTAGLTALWALEKGGPLLHKRMLITGSTGGVGLFAHQLARLSGASSQSRVHLRLPESCKILNAESISSYIQNNARREGPGEMLLAHSQRFAYTHASSYHFPLSLENQSANSFRICINFNHSEWKRENRKNRGKSEEKALGECWEKIICKTFVFWTAWKSPMHVCGDQQRNQLSYGDVLSLSLLL